MTFSIPMLFNVVNLFGQVLSRFFSICIIIIIIIYRIYYRNKINHNSLGVIIIMIACIWITHVTETIKLDWFVGLTGHATSSIHFPSPCNYAALL